MTPADRAILDELARRVRAVFPTARVWGFGSRARGDASRESDLDVCVVLERLDRGSRNRVSDLAWEVGFAAGVVISTVAYSRQEFEDGPCSASALVKAVLREGVAA
jgi:predicted nucleotidyltransferase